MSKLASKGGDNKADTQDLGIKGGSATAENRAQAAQAAAAAVPAKAVVPGKAAPMPFVQKAQPLKAEAVKKAEDEEENAGAAQGDGEDAPAELAMVDASSAAYTMQDSGATSADGTTTTDSGDDDGGVSAPLIIGGVLLVGGGIALAAGGGGGKSNTAPTSTAQTAAVNEDAKITGKLTATDADGDTLTFAVGTSPAGFALVGTDGSYTFDASNAAYQSLAAGATQNVAVNFTVSDGKGGSAAQTLTITVTGVNDAPTTTAQTATGAEDTKISGKLTATDVDAGATLSYATTGTVPAGFTLATDGSYTLDATNAAYQSLAAGASQNVVANFVVSDGKGGSAAQTLTITVTGVNDAPTTTAQTATAIEDGAVVSGKLTAADVDAGATLTFATTGTIPAGFTLNSDGSYTFDPGSYDSLGAGVTQNVVANFLVTDAKGGSVANTLTITVTGINDVPVGAAATAAATEDGAVVTGQLAATDADAGDTLTYTLNAPVAGLTLNANGSYSFDPASYDSIPQGSTQTVVANYTVSDGKGGSATSTLTITVTGINDAPVAVADTAAVTEGAAISGNVATNDSDADTGATRTYTLAAPVAGLTLNADGTYSFNAANAAYDSLGLGVTQNVVANYVVTDDKGATATSTLTITVTGVNDAPVGVAATAAATEDGAVVTGQLAATDVDAGDTLTYSLNAPVTGLTLNANGSFSFDPASYDSLGAGVTQNVVANYTVSDGKGGSATSTLTITVTGINDAPVGVAATAAATEDGAVVTGKLAATDVDVGDTLTYSLNAPVAGLTLNANGSYSFDPASYDSIPQGATQTVVANYTVSDGKGGSATSTLTIAVTGVNDAPVFTSGTTASVNENLPATTVVYTAAATDVDTGTTLTYGLSGADAGLLTIDPVTGQVRLAASANYEAKQTYNFNVTVNDGITTVSQAVVLTINNQVDILSIDVGNDQNIVTIDASGNLPEDVLDVNYGFQESGNTPNDVILTNFTANDYIQFGTNLANYNFNNTGGDLVITQNNGGVVSRIVIDNVLNPNDLLQNNEAAAEAALNAAFGTTGVDYLRGSSFSAVTRSADVDNDNNANTPASATGPSPLAPVPGLDAAGAAVTYTESANAANTVVISNFTGDDKIVVSGATQDQYNFTVAGNNQDLIITYNNGGIVSSITLEGFFQTPPPPNVLFGTNEAKVEAFVGFDFFSYA